MFDMCSVAAPKNHYRHLQINWDVEYLFYGDS